MSDYNRQRRNEYRPERNEENPYRRTGYGQSHSDSYGSSNERRGQDYGSYGNSGYGYDRRRDLDGDRSQSSYQGDEYTGNFSGSNYDRDYEFGMNRRGYSNQSGQYTNSGYRDFRDNPNNLGVGSNYAYNREGYGSNYGGEYGRHDQRDYGSGYAGEFGGASYSHRRGQGYDPNREYSSYSGRYDRSYEKDWKHDNRDWFDRAGDEVASWFGDEDAERRRRMDKQESHKGRGPKGYRRSDSRIEEDINDRLSDDGWVDAREIEIEVKNGEVVLTGFVTDRFAKRRIEDIVESVSGVSNVENRIRTGQPYSQAASASGTGRSVGSGTNGVTGNSDGERSRSRTAS